MSEKPQTKLEIPAQEHSGSSYIVIKKFFCHFKGEELDVGTRLETNKLTLAQQTYCMFANLFGTLAISRG